MKTLTQLLTPSPARRGGVRVLAGRFIRHVRGRVHADCARGRSWWKRHRALAGAGAGLAAHLALAGLVCLLASCATGTAIIAARIYPGPADAPIDNGVVLVRRGRITAVGSREDIAIPRRFRVIDRSQSVLVAGFWNSHVHPVSERLLQSASMSDDELHDEFSANYLPWGFTTVIDLASNTDIAARLKIRLKASARATPHLLGVGSPFYPRDGTPVYAKPIYRALGLASDEVNTPEQASAKVSGHARAGMDAIKVFTASIIGGPDDVVLMDRDIVRAITAQAHRHGLPVFAHPTNNAGLRLAVDNGVDVLAHSSPLAGPWSQSFASGLVSKNIALVPTLHLFVLQPHESTPVKVAQQQVAALSAAGGEMLFGTDAGYTEDYSPLGEYKLLGQVMGWQQVLAALTTAPAARMGKAGETGRIATGMAADLVVLYGDPAVDVENFAQVSDTFVDGKPGFTRASPEP